MAAAFPAPLASAPAPLLVGLSGGLDSSVLLHWLASSPAVRAAGLRALHIHHGLQAGADDWAAHCQALGRRLQLPVGIVRVQVAPAGHGIEDAARQARRAAWAAALAPGEWLVLGHHRDDQAETFLLRALRGSGCDGLAAMREHDRLGPQVLWRPLLALPRSALLAYAREHGLDWVEDPSNTGADYDRNFLRHQVLPLLQARFPQAAQRLALAATRCADDAALLQAGEHRLLAAIERADHSLPVAALLDLPATERARVLRLWLRERGAPPLPGHLHRLLDAQVLACSDDRQARLAWRGRELRRWRDGLHLLPAQAQAPAHWQQGWDGRTPLLLPDGRRWQLCGGDGFARPLQVRLRRGGERLRLPGRDHHTPLKDCLQQAGIAPWQRPWLPLLFAGDSLLAAGDALYAAAFAPPLVPAGAHLRLLPAAAGD